MSHATTHRASSRRKVVSRPALPALTALSAALLGLTSLSAQAQDATLFSVVRNPPVFQGEDNVNAASGSSGIQAQGNVGEATLPPARQRNVRLDVGSAKFFYRCTIPSMLRCVFKAAYRFSRCAE